MIVKICNSALWPWVGIVILHCLGSWSCGSYNQHYKPKRILSVICIAHRARWKYFFTEDFVKFSFCKFQNINNKISFCQSIGSILSIFYALLFYRSTNLKNNNFLNIRHKKYFGSFCQQNSNVGKYIFQLTQLLIMHTYIFCSNFPS